MAVPGGGPRVCSRCGAGVPLGAKQCPRDGSPAVPLIEAPVFPTQQSASDHTVIDSRAGQSDRTVMTSAEPAKLLPIDAVVDATEQYPSSPGLTDGPEADPHAYDRTVMRQSSEMNELGGGPTDPSMGPLTDPRRPRPIDPLIGQKLGEYVIEQKIGSGGMGIVYRGVQPVIGKPVAIKVLKPDVASQPGQMERLLAEARAVNAIRHRSIIDIFSFGQLPDGRHYVVMEFLEGEGLDAFMKKRSPLPLDEAVPLLEEILSALAAAHGAGVIHRDLKPSNIFVVTPRAGPRYLKLLDFGLAKQAALPGASTPQTRLASIVGTPDYMAPEQARGDPVGPFTDLYSFGCVAFQMLTGRLPFQGESAMVVLLEHQERPPPRPSSINPSLPPSVDKLLLELLAKSPSARPASADEVLLSIARWRDGPARRGSPPVEPMRAASTSETADRTRLSRPLERASAVEGRARQSDRMARVRTPPRPAVDEPEMDPPSTRPEPVQRHGPVPLQDPNEEYAPTRPQPLRPELAAPRGHLGVWVAMAAVAGAALVVMVALLLFKPPGKKPPPAPHEVTAQLEPSEVQPDSPPGRGEPPPEATPQPPPDEPPLSSNASGTESDEKPTPKLEPRPRPAPDSPSPAQLVARIAQIRHKLRSVPPGKEPSPEAFAKLSNLEFDARDASTAEQRRRVARALTEWERRYLP